jgi:hypothetical protein
MSAIGNIFKSVFKGISNIATGVLTLNPGKILGGVGDIASGVLYPASLAANTLMGNGLNDLLNPRNRG